VRALSPKVEPLDDVFTRGLAAIRGELDIEDPPEGAIAEAEAAVRAGPSIPATEDCLDVPFVTIDPVGSRDLDQALYISERSDGWEVLYAIADLAAFVRPGGEIDLAAQNRGVTIYLPDAKSPLHPTALSEAAASLLPGEVRQALVWRIGLDKSGGVTDRSVRRARVRSRAALSYQQVQAALDAGTGDDLYELLRAVGEAREAVQAARGGLDLRLPDQTVVAAAGTYELVYRAALPVEGWNAQISLLTGECAAQLMLDAGIGILRTLPAPTAETVEQLRRHARALHVQWPDGVGYAQFVRSLDPRIADHAALVMQSAKLARGAGYVAFTEKPSGDVTHSAVAAPYAHVTAPLRRLVDRFANEIVLAACAGQSPPEWAVAALAGLPELMAKATAREHAAERMVISLAEAAVLTRYVGATVDGVVVDVDQRRTAVQLLRPAVVADIAAAPQLSLGDEVRVRVVAADPVTRSVRLEVVA
jgi:exoribonuclease R